MELSRLIGIIVAATLVACGPPALQFQQTSPSSYSGLIPQALQLDEEEMAIVIKAGGIVIGTIPGPRPGESIDSISDRAGKVAGKHGGTHFVLSAAPLESFKPSATVACPPGATGSDGKPCPTTDAAPTNTAAPVPESAKASEDPAGPPRYVVVRIEPEDWKTLQREIRPKRFL